MENLNFLYHSTTKENTNNIKLEGFNSEMTLFCSDMKHAVEFLSLYSVVGDYAVIEVDVSELDIKNPEESTDHNPQFFNKELKAYTYFGEVPYKAITGFYEATVETK